MSLNYLVPLVKCVLSWKINLAFFEKTTTCLPIFICRYIFSQQRFCDTTQYICCFDAFIENTFLQTWRRQTSKIKYSCVLSHDVHWGNDIHLTKTNSVVLLLKSNQHHIQSWSVALWKTSSKNTLLLEVHTLKTRDKEIE